MSRLGARAAWVGRVGADAPGQLITRELEAEGVGGHVIEDPDAQTGFMLKERRRPGSASVTYYRRDSAGSRLRPADVGDELLSVASVVHTSGITLALSETARETVHDVFGRARRLGVPVSFDVNHRDRLWSSPELARREYADVLPACDLLFAGEDEARILVGERPPEDLARALADLGPPCVVIKQGAAGATAYDGDSVIARPSFPVEVVDIVGAGDAFAAGFLTARVRRRPLDECLRTATATGAVVCTGSGDWESAAYPDDLEAVFAGRDNIR